MRIHILAQQLKNSWLQGPRFIKFTILLTCFFASFNPHCSIFETNSTQCKKQWVRTMQRFCFSTKDANPFIQPTIDGALSVNIPTHEFQDKPYLSRHIVIVSKISWPSAVVGNCLQHRNWLIMASSSITGINAINCAWLLIPVDSSFWRANRLFWNLALHFPQYYQTRQESFAELHCLKEGFC